MGKLKLIPEPTFKAKVAIARAGAPDDSIEFTFKHRTRDELEAFIKSAQGREDIETVLDMCAGWDLAEAFDKASLELLTQNYISASRSVFDTYVEELSKARAKN